MSIIETMYPVFELLILILFLMVGLVVSFIIRDRWGYFKPKFKKKYKKYEEILRDKHGGI